MSTPGILLTFFGLFLAGGAISFWKQKMPKGVVAVLVIGSVLTTTAGLLRL